MRVDKAGTSEGPIIAGFSAGGFRVNDSEGVGNVYRALLLTPRRADGWAPPRLADLSVDEVAPLLALDPLPEFLLLGSGASLARPSPAFIRAIEARGLGVDVMDSRAAARAWAVLRGEGRWIAAALYPLA